MADITSILPYYIISGLLVGSIYGLATIGLTLIFGVLRVVNVGHGAYIMIGMYVTFWLFTLYSLNPFITLIPAFLVGLALGMLLFYVALKRLLRAPELSTLISTFGFGVILEELAKVLWGADYRGFVYSLGSLYFQGIPLPLVRVWPAVIALGLVIALYVLLYRTRLGVAVRAVTQDPEGAMVCGVDVERVYFLTVALGIGLTTASGALLAIYFQQGINPYIGHLYTLRAFVIAVLGGLGSPIGAFIGGLIVGVIEQASVPLFTMLGAPNPFGLSVFLTFTLILVILLLRPQGLLGR
ncbi:MAG: branched-chain amino acid ABC transporter permease [Desulfurococcaceae archaeon]|nr:branched-chain amino acid ABC transporter permease [Desulfurococcaceae archaeon]MCC6059941.1 branched-chain amino acid ABC transporter permease [Desulfurococcaceae archaeon]